jgi:hypothetical protein
LTQHTGLSGFNRREAAVPRPLSSAQIAKIFAREMPDLEWQTDGQYALYRERANNILQCIAFEKHPGQPGWFFVELHFVVLCTGRDVWAFTVGERFRGASVSWPLSTKEECLVFLKTHGVELSEFFNSKDDVTTLLKYAIAVDVLQDAPEWRRGPRISEDIIYLHLLLGDAKSARRVLHDYELLFQKIPIPHIVAEVMAILAKIKTVMDDKEALAQHLRDNVISSRRALGLPS